MQNSDKKQEKKDILKILYALFDGRERNLDAFENKIFPMKIEGTGFSDLSMRDKYIALSNLSIYYAWKNIKKSYKNNKFKIPVPAWNELPDGSYSMLDIQEIAPNISSTNMR